MIYKYLTNLSGRRLMESDFRSNQSKTRLMPAAAATANCTTTDPSNGSGVRPYSVFNLISLHSDPDSVDRSLRPKFRQFHPPFTPPSRVLNRGWPIVKDTWGCRLSDVDGVRSPPLHDPRFQQWRFRGIATRRTGSSLRSCIHQARGPASAGLFHPTDAHIRIDQCGRITRDERTNS